MKHEVHLREVRQFTNRLQNLARSAPDSVARREIRSTAAKLHFRFGLSPEEQTNAILGVLDSGAVLLSEISDESGLGTNRTREILNNLIDRGEVFVQDKPLHGTRGRPTKHYYRKNDK